MIPNYLYDLWGNERSHYISFHHIPLNIIPFMTRQTNSKYSYGKTKAYHKVVQMKLENPPYPEKRGVQCIKLLYNA